MKEKFWESVLMILVFAMSGVESCPLLFVPIIILGAMAFYNLRDIKIEC